MTNTPRILVVDGISETETVLKAVLEPQGALVERRRSSDAPLADAVPPRVVIVDGDDQPSAGSADIPWPGVPRVVLGSKYQPMRTGTARFLEKPFHYPELIRLVQSLLDLPTERRRVG